MKKLLPLLFLLNLTLNTSAQTFLSDKFPKLTDFYERINLYDKEGNAIVSLAPKFYKEKNSRICIKPIKVDGSTYFIKRRKNGSESVYTESGEHVALISRNNATIHLVKENQKYTFKPVLKLANFNILECKNSEGIVVSKTLFNYDRTLTYQHYGAQNPNLLLMSLCTHQYQELLLGGRGKLSSRANLRLLTAL